MERPSLERRRAPRAVAEFAIQLADRQKELARQAVRIGDVGLFFVVRANRPTHPELVPPDFVHAIVVATAIGHRHTIEIAVRQQRT